jgi:hypothetical protein
MGLAAALGALGLGGYMPVIAASAAPAGQHAAVRADAATARTFSGHTSQHEPITFTIASGKVRKLSFWIVISCKSHHSYRLRASGFAPIPIHSDRFHVTGSSTDPAAKATITGHRRSGHVRGTLSVTRYVTAERASCAGTATYTAGH